MRISTSILKVIFLVATLSALTACGKGNSDVPNVDSGKHPVNWTGQHGAVATTSTSSCTQCHGEDLAGGVTRVGCFSTPQSSFNGFVCHASSPEVNKDCSSCHGTPPNGTALFNRASAHAKHLAVTGVTCNSCHNGAGFGTVNHGKGITTVLLTDNLKAKVVTTTFAYDSASGTCSAVICHGGKTTPNWNTGSTDCINCHEQGTAAQIPQFNSFYTGVFPFPDGKIVNLHQFHLAAKDPTSPAKLPITCSSCHNSGKLAPQHFNRITTPAFDGVPGDSIGGGNTNISNYTPFTSVVPSGSCANNCHAFRFWIN